MYVRNFTKLASSSNTKVSPSSFKNVQQGQPRSFATGKEIHFGGSARNRMKKGVDRMADAVQVTLGPRGRNVAIQSAYGPPKITKDGVTVAKSIDLEDPLENMGAQLCKNVANKTNDVAGDGTTTATVLARAIFGEGTKAVEAGMNPMDLKRGIDLAVDHVTTFLREKLSKQIDTPEQIEQVATISANNDSEIGKLIAHAMAKVGKDGAITVTDGKTLQNEVEVIEGMKFDQGALSRYFFTDAKTQTCIFDDPLILVTDQKISNVYSMIPLLEKVSKSGRKLLIIADNVEGDALATLIMNRLRGFPVCAVKAPGFGDSRTNYLQDISTLTGATLITEESGIKMEDVELENLGTSKKVTVGKDDSLILGGGGRPEAIQERISVIQESLVQATSEYEKEKLQERLSKLSGGVAVLKVGGASEVEVNEKKDRIIDALNATKAAAIDGIVPGGGTALLYASRALDTLKKELKEKNFDQGQGVQIIQNALLMPCKTIANNAGVEGSVVVEKLLSQQVLTWGYDAQANKYTDMIKSGIIDPTKVVKTALVDAASVASLMTTTEAVVTEIPSKQAAQPSGPFNPPMEPF